ncbi:transposase [Micromonospora sp. WMMD723]|uniref:transposase n=1 Tax=Micromonospora sp. WMMD723 TaxID=3403465 RepID=UPI003CF2B129
MIRRLAEQLGVHHEALRNWIRQAEADADERHDRPTSEMAEENRRLRREITELRRAGLCETPQSSSSSVYTRWAREAGSQAQEPICKRCRISETGAP